MRLRSLLPSVFLFGFGCNLFNTMDHEDVRGRGAKAFDPYGAQSGARRLVLQQYMGCAIDHLGQPVAPQIDIPYPETCPDIFHFPEPGEVRRSPPYSRFEVLANTSYFLNQLTLHDQWVRVSQTPEQAEEYFHDVAGAAYWMKNHSQFKSLDWSHLSRGRSRWFPDFAGTDVWHREVSFTSAAWQDDMESSFLLEVLDESGEVRANQMYKRSEFLAENRVSGHSVVSHLAQAVSPPRSPGDSSVETPFGFGIFRAVVKVELFGSANPFKQFTMPDISGEGAIRITWSAMPTEPFYFPVTFVKEKDRELTCFSAADHQTPVACGPGVDPVAELSRPANGEFYRPGDTFQMRILIKDGNGNLLHPKDELPSFMDFVMGTDNGIIQYNFMKFFNLIEEDNEMAWQIIGPLHKAGRHEDIANERPPYQSFPHNFGALTGIGQIIPAAAGGFSIPGGEMVRWSTTQPVTIPEAAEPGTYALFLKVGRQYLGERVNKGTTVYFQVGQEEETRWPGRVGNCQICHRGVLSLENLRHGFSVNDVEGCKSCHKTNYYNLSRDIHLLHMDSPRYTVAKNDCTFCHLTQESATTATLEVCSTCHLSVHGEEFFDIKFELYGTPSRYGKCAEACHTATPPSQHILPIHK